MRANSGSAEPGRVRVFLNGKQVKDAFYADEEAGVVWAAYRDVHGKLVAECDAEDGARFWQGCQVIRLTGAVRIDVEVGEGEDAAEIRERIHRSSGPPKIEFYAD